MVDCGRWRRVVAYISEAALDMASPHGGLWAVEARGGVYLGGGSGYGLTSWWTAGGGGAWWRISRRRLWIWPHLMVDCGRWRRVVAYISEAALDMASPHG